MSEKKLHLFAFAIVILGMELYLLNKDASLDFKRSLFVMSAISFFFLYFVFEQFFLSIELEDTAPLFSIMPGILLYSLIHANSEWITVAYAAVLAAALRLILSYLPYKDKVILYGTFVLDIFVLYLWAVQDIFVGRFLTDKLLIVSLVVLTLSSVQQIIFEKNAQSYPFQFFMMMGVVLLVIPMKQAPIDWSPVANLGNQLMEKVIEASYNMPEIFGHEVFTTGYSNFGTVGGRLNKSDKVQVVLETLEKPFFVYTDTETDKRMKARRTIYLTGGEGVNQKNLIDFLQLLYDNNQTRESVRIYSRLSRVSIEYAYIDTFDEIAPENSILITADGKEVVDGVGARLHKKGYQLKCRFLEIDYGSPTLAKLYQNAGIEGVKHELSYSEACDYARQIYGIDLSSLMDESRYQELKRNDASENKKYLATGKANDRMQQLSKDITESCKNEYDKCKAIEKYVRQYPYSMEAVGGHNPDSDLTTPEGMADIADRFLFETKTGYCVHSASSMVMLLRYAGIPARVMRGFRYDYPFEQQQYYYVRANCAHTWPEAYIENVGWVPFEPTGAYFVAEDHSWHRESEAEYNTMYENINLNETIVPEIPEDNFKEDTIDKGLEILKFAGLFVLSVLALLIVIFAITLGRKRVKYMLGTPEDRLKMDVVAIKKKLAYQSKVPTLDRGLLFDYVELAPNEYKENLRGVFDAYYRIIYGNSGSVLPQEGQMARNLREQLKKVPKE